jgi:hypothetical protein
VRMRQRSESEIPFSRRILGGAAGYGLSPLLAGGRGKPAGGRSGTVARGRGERSFLGCFFFSTPVLKFLAFPLPPPISSFFPFPNVNKSKLNLHPA